MIVSLPFKIEFTYKICLYLNSKNSNLKNKPFWMFRESFSVILHKTGRHKINPTYKFRI
jgi:hypothetical protein